MSGFLDNCVNFGGDVLATNGEYRKMLLDFYDTVMTSRNLGAEDRCVACKLGEAMLLSLRGNIDEVRHVSVSLEPLPRTQAHSLFPPSQAIPTFIERSMTFLLSKNTDEDFVVTTSLYLHSLEVLISSILYNPALSLAILDGHDWTQQFFANWFKNLPKMTRVHDKKMTIAAICALLEWLATVGAGAPLAQSSSQLVVGAIQVFRELPLALASEWRILEPR